MQSAEDSLQFVVSSIRLNHAETHNTGSVVHLANVALALAQDVAHRPQHNLQNRHCQEGALN